MAATEHKDLICFEITLTNFLKLALKNCLLHMNYLLSMFSDIAK